MTSTPPPLWPKASDQLVATLRARLKGKRFRHVLGVLQTALGLADAHGVDREAVGWVALLHDIAKCDDHSTMPAICEELGEPIPPEDMPSQGLWHAWAAAGEAKRDWGITDPALLDALRYHSTGAPDMGPVAKILVAADVLEPTRGIPERFPLLIRARHDLDGALIDLLRSKCDHLASRGLPIHPRAQQTLDSLSGKTEPKPQEA